MNIVLLIIACAFTIVYEAETNVMKSKVYNPILNVFICHLDLCLACKVDIGMHLIEIKIVLLGSKM